MFFFEAIWLWIEMDLCMSCYRTLLFNVLCSSMEEANPLPLSPVLVLAVLISQFPLCVQTKFAFHFSQNPFLFSLFLIPVTLLSDANVFYLILFVTILQWLVWIWGLHWFRGEHHFSWITFLFFPLPHTIYQTYRSKIPSWFCARLQNRQFLDS